MPHFTPKGWWECDLFEVTKAGYAREYEIKISRSDFKADADKRKIKWTLDATCRNWRQIDLGSKHDKLKNCDAAGPSQFWYVMPITLGIPETEVPEWAGIIHAEKNEHASYGVKLHDVRQAPKLHRVKSTIVLNDLHETAWWRFIRLYINPRSK